MKQILLILVLGLLLAAQSFAECSTTVSGTIDGETWTQEGSPYCVEGDITVAGLTIEPGVIVEFSGDYAFNVSGTLTAVGTSDAVIEFLKADGVTGWQGISVLGASQNSRFVYCTISGYHNGGLKIYNSTPEVRNCYMIGNDGAESGSGLYVSLSTSATDELVVESSAISNNKKYGDGAGIYAELSAGSMILRNCTINNNTSTYESTGNRYGGGIYASANGGLTLENCEISGNGVKARCSSNSCSSYSRGGGLFMAYGSVIIKNTIIKSNSVYASAGGSFTEYAYAEGAGIYAGTGYLQLLNSIVSNNAGSASADRAYTRGGGIFNSLGTVEMTNCTTVSNAPYGLYHSSGVSQIKNSILYSNSEGQIYGTATVTYSDVQDGYDGEGNIDADPLFKNTLTYQTYCDYSPCTDAGSTYPWYNDSCFLPSCGGEQNDMGAYGGPDACGWCAYEGSITLSPCEVPEKGDFDEDGDVDATDLLIFSGNYGR
nr:right-handed parallel beta-helix repeat-containing protein [uncultured Desulfobacter sp.]